MLRLLRRRKIFGPTANLLACWTDPLPACYGLSLFTTLSARHTIKKHVGGDGEVKGTNSSGAASSAAASRGSHSGGARGDTRSAPSAHVNEDEEASLGLSKQALQWRKEKDGWAAAMRLRTRETLKDDMDDTPEEEEDVVGVRETREKLGSRLDGGIGAELDDLAEKGTTATPRDQPPLS